MPLSRRTALLLAVLVVGAILAPAAEARSVPAQSGSVSPSATGPDPLGTIYVADCGGSAIDVFAPGSNGDIAPERSIQGPDTGLDNPCDVKVDSAGDVFAANLGGSGSITEYAPQASGDASPICTLTGSNTGLTYNGLDDFSLEANGTLVVGTYLNSSVLVFAPGSCGNVAPVETIAGSNTGFNTVDGVGTDANGTIYADDSEGISINVFPAGANGNVAPAYQIAGPDTDLTGPDDIVVSFSGKLYVTNGFNFGSGGNSVVVYSPGATGDATPIQYIAGFNTGFGGGVDDLAVDDSGNIFVTDALADAVDVFAAGATGDVAPTAVISGSNTTFFEPEGVAVAGPSGPPKGASVTARVSKPAISLGHSTADTATVTRGTNNTSPTGALVFTLYGPDDTMCSKAPAYVSPAQSVSGSGTHTSPSFTPTATGIYGWVVQYSGDTHNAAVTTACADPNESVTVTKAVAKACVVPKVVRKRLGAARRAIKAHNCRVGKIKHAFSAKIHTGDVISQKPKPHKRLKHGAKVNLVVSKGKRH